MAELHHHVIYSPLLMTLVPTETSHFIDHLNTTGKKASSKKFNVKIPFYLIFKIIIPILNLFFSYNLENRRIVNIHQKAMQRIDTKPFDNVLILQPYSQEAMVVQTYRNSNYHPQLGTAMIFQGSQTNVHLLFMDQIQHLLTEVLLQNLMKVAVT